jgi:hypothetical protein
MEHTNAKKLDLQNEAYTFSVSRTIAPEYDGIVERLRRNIRDEPALAPSACSPRRADRQG